jgi:murein DD-endopeptidase MepM/ murein hydrolase activator NlpD
VKINIHYCDSPYNKKCTAIRHVISENEVMPMKKILSTPIIFLAIFLLLVSAACIFGGSSTTEESSDAPAAEAESTVADSPTLPPEEPPAEEPTTLPPTEAPAPTDIPPEEPEQTEEELIACSEEICLENGSFLLSRPLAPSGRNTIDPSYRFGDYRQSMQITHRGVDFLNSTGTSVVAAADGVVVVAGDDLNIPYGPRKNYYGNLVILEHDLAGYPDPVYTLYSQLSEVLVEEGDAVATGQEIGLVGMSGAAPGSTLHFEVRVGENSYLEARNPELWLNLLSDEKDQAFGALAGRVIDDQGVYQPVENIVIEQLAGPGLPAIDQFYLTTYEKKELRGQSPWHESFAMSDLPPGEYQITFMLNGLQQKEVEVEPGMLTLVTFLIEEAP